MSAARRPDRCRPQRDRHRRAAFRSVWSRTASAQDGGFPPINLIKPELPKLETGRRVTHAYLGLATAAADNAQGALVKDVTLGTSAADARLRTGNIIVAFNGTKIANANDLIESLAAAHPGQKITLAAIRGSDKLTRTVTLGTQPEQRPAG